MTLTDLSPEALMDRMQTELPAAPIEVVRMYRDELLVREAAEGIGALHRVASELVAGRRALVHSAQHDEKLTALAVSPCGHYLATGAWCGDDYEEGGDLVVWDLRTCAAVHVVSNIRGGVGWPWHPGQLRWAGDSQSLYLGFDTNRVGRLAVFATEAGWGLPGASLTGGWDSLPAWALAPDGTVAVLVPREDDEDQAIALFRVEDDDVEEADCTWLDNRIPAGMVREDEDADGDDPTRAVTTIYSGARIDCPDERRVLVHNKDTLLCFDRGTRRLVWRSRVAKPVGISAGAEFIAHHPAGVVFYRGADGLPSPWLPMHVGASALVFEPARGGERPPRMAAVIEADNDYGAEPGVHIYDGGEFVCGPDLAPASSSDEFDFPALAWSPDGGRFVCLTCEETLEVWRIDGRGAGATARREHEIAEVTGKGVVWAAEDRVVVAGGDSLVFVDPRAGRIVARRAVVADEAEFDPRADELPRRDRFALHGAWVILRGDGVVVGAGEGLDAQLGWVVDRRVGWPLRWCPPVVEAPTAVVAEAVPEFPPARVGDAVDVLRALVTSTAALGRGWRSNRSELLRLAAREFARRGLVDDASGCLEDIPEFADSIAARAEVVAILAGAGRGAEAQAIRAAEGYLQRSGEDLEIDEDSTYQQALYGSSLGAMCHALGDLERAERWFLRAEAAVDNDEANAGDHRHMLALGYLLAGRDDRALALLRRPLAGAPSSHSALPLVAYLARHGKWEMVDAYVRDGWIGAHGADAFELLPILARYADPERVAAYAGLFADAYDVEEYLDPEALAGRRGLPPTPGEADIAGLREAFGGVMRLPTRRRAGAAAEVLERAIAVGHWSAAIVLLEFLDGTDMNGRGRAAAELTWRALSGLDVPVW